MVSVVLCAGTCKSGRACKSTKLLTGMRYCVMHVPADTQSKLYKHELSILHDRNRAMSHRLNVLNSELEELRIEASTVAKLKEQIRSLEDDNAEYRDREMCIYLSDYLLCELQKTFPDYQGRWCHLLYMEEHRDLLETLFRVPFEEVPNYYRDLIRRRNRICHPAGSRREYSII